MGGSDEEREEEEAATDLLRDKFRLSTISIAEAEGLLSIFSYPSHIFITLLISILTNPKIDVFNFFHSQAKQYGNF